MTNLLKSALCYANITITPLWFAATSDLLCQRESGCPLTEETAGGLLRGGVDSCGF